MAAPSHIIAVETYGSQRVRAPASGAMVSAFKIGYGTVGRAVLLALFGSRALDVTSRHASYHYISLEGSVSTQKGFLLLALTDEEFARVQQITRPHPSRRTGIFRWHGAQWWYFPYRKTVGEDVDFTPVSQREGPGIDPSRYRVTSISRGEGSAAIEGIRAEYSQRSPHEAGWWWITGDTYPHRDLLRLRGCRWSKKRGAWYYQGAVLPDAIQQLVQRLPASTSLTYALAAHETPENQIIPETPPVISQASSTSDTPPRQTMQEVTKPLVPDATDVPEIRILPPPSLANMSDSDSVAQALRDTPRSACPPPKPLLHHRDKKLRISHAPVGELTGSITGNVWCYGFAMHGGVLLYLNLAGPRMAVEAIRAKLGKGEVVSLVPPDAPALELSAGETGGKPNTGQYEAFIQTMPEVRFTNAILVHAALQPASRLGFTGVLRTSEAQATRKIHYLVQSWLAIPVFPIWANFLLDAGQRAGLIRPAFPRGGGIDVLIVERDLSAWQRLITGGLVNGVITLPEMAVQ